MTFRPLHLAPHHSPTQQKMSLSTLLPLLACIPALWGIHLTTCTATSSPVITKRTKPKTVSHLGARERPVPVTNNEPASALQGNLCVTTLFPFSPCPLSLYPCPQKIWLPPTPNFPVLQGHINTLAASLPLGELQQSPSRKGS